MKLHLYISISIVLYSALTVSAVSVVDGVVLLIWSRYVTANTVVWVFALYWKEVTLALCGFTERCAWVFWNVWLRKWELLRNYLPMDFVNTFYNNDKLRNGIITNAMNRILENVFTSCFPAILNKCSFGTSSREYFICLMKWRVQLK